MRTDNSVDVCANCGDPYAAHGPDTQCPRGIQSKWFPGKIAAALTRQKKRIRRAQIALGKQHKAKATS